MSREGFYMQVSYTGMGGCVCEVFVHGWGSVSLNQNGLFFFFTEPHNNDSAQHIGNKHHQLGGADFSKKSKSRKSAW
jgi:hypothetical protein